MKADSGRFGLTPLHDRFKAMATSLLTINIYTILTVDDTKYCGFCGFLSIKNGAPHQS